MLPFDPATYVALRPLFRCSEGVSVGRVASSLEEFIFAHRQGALVSAGTGRTRWRMRDRPVLSASRLLATQRPIPHIGLNSITYDAVLYYGSIV
eukprot:6004568-Heterocapsa_arctica.AAC.1